MYLHIKMKKLSEREGPRLISQSLLIEQKNNRKSNLVFKDFDAFMSRDVLYVTTFNIGLHTYQIHFHTSISIRLCFYAIHLLNVENVITGNECTMIHQICTKYLYINFRSRRKCQMPRNLVWNETYCIWGFYQYYAICATFHHNHFMLYCNHQEIGRTVSSSTWSPEVRH